MIDISQLSSKYLVRRLDTSDLDDIVELCRENTVFYKYTAASPTRENILDDMKVTPPGIEVERKHYFGFFEEDELIAVMDLIDGYPKADTAYIGFFMMRLGRQGRQVGTSIVGEVIGYLRSIGMTAVRLAIDKGNPQSTHFWMKNGFVVVNEVDVNGWTKLVAERTLW